MLITSKGEYRRKARYVLALRKYLLMWYESESRRVTVVNLNAKGQKAMTENTKAYTVDKKTFEQVFNAVSEQIIASAKNDVMRVLSVEKPEIKSQPEPLTDEEKIAYAEGQGRIRMNIKPSPAQQEVIDKVIATSLPQGVAENVADATRGAIRQITRVVFGMLTHSKPAPYNEYKG